MTHITFISHRCLLFLFGLQLSLQLCAAPLDVQNFTSRDGLSHNSATCFFQDRKGFLWIGTTNGLNRYDGYQFKTFTNKPDDSLSLQGSVIYTIQDDKRGRLLLSTDAGFFIFNPRDESFRKQDIEGMSNFYMVNFCFDDSGHLWGLADLKTLIQIDTATYRIRKRIPLDSLYANKNAGINFALHFYDGRLWIGGSLGVTCFDYKRRKTSLITTDIDPMFMYLRGMSDGCKKHSLLIVDGVRGVYEINTATLACTHTPLASFEHLLPGLTTITGATFDTRGGIWVTSSNGLFFVTPRGDIQLINAEAGAPHDWGQTEPNGLFTDRDGIIWVGTMNDGVFAFHNRLSSFTQISIHKGNRGVPVTSIIAQGNKIVAGSKSGIFSIDKKNGFVPNSYLDSMAHAIAYDKDKNLIFFTDETVYRCDQAKNIRLKARMSMKYMHYGILDSRGILWSAHWGWGLEGFDSNTGKRYKIDVVPNDLQKNIVNTLYEDADGSLWLASYGSGLVHVEHPATGHQKLTIYTHKKDTNSLSNNIILSIHDDGRGSIWLGTNGGGLNRFDKRTRKFDVFTTKDGLKSNVVNAIQSDLDGNVWFASTCMSKYDIRKKTFAHFDLSDGVDCKYFTGATLRDNDGLLYFGNDQGILTFDPRTITTGKDARTPLFTGVRLFGQSVDTRDRFGEDCPFPIAPDFASSIELPYYLNTFSVEFASIELLDNRNITYSYKLEGVDNRWILMPFGERTATFSGIQPGKYLLKVKALYSAGIESQERTMQIIITPPWRQTLAFRVFFIIIIVSLISIFVYSRVRRIEKRNRILEETVLSRTSELQAANRTLSQQADTLNKQTERLSAQAESLQEQNKALNEQKMFIEMKNLQLNEAIDSTDRLIGVIAHDFKNPLAAIYGLSALLRENNNEIDPDKIKKYSESIASASDSLRRQMISVLDWVQNRDEKLVAKPVEVNIGTILEDAVDLLRESANQKDIRMTMQLEYATNCLVDPRMISVVFRNLLNNAIKFTHRGGSIHLMIIELDDFIEVSVIDTGVGIDTDRQHVLFINPNKAIDTFGTEREQGTGYGLQLCKAYVEKNCGAITFTSAEGEGSNFTVQLPKGQDKAPVKRHLVVDKGGGFLLSQESGKDKYSIVIIDDNAEVLDMMFETFSKEYNVIKAQDGKEGMFLALNMLPDIIVCDIGLPGIDGLELCTMLKSQVLTSHIPILLISSQKNSDIQNLCFTAGATDFIEKPFNPFVLKQKIRSLLEYKFKLEQQIRQQIEMGVLTKELPVDYNSKIIDKVIKFIHDNLSDETLDTNTIADRIGVSRSQLWRIFKNATGKTLGDYIRGFRMQKAVEMLKTGRFKVSEIAIEVGYSNPRYFIRAFTKEFGVSPSEYLDKTNKVVV